MSEAPVMTPSQFVDVLNETLDVGFTGVLLVGEVASFKVNQGKWVFFDLKDEETSVSCFMSVWSLRIPLEDGMKVVLRGTPKVTKWGKFSVTVSAIKPVGEGSLKKAYEMLKKKLTLEGLFDASKKRGLPENLERIGVISSTQAAGYADFIKILNARWGGMKVTVAHTQVQGLDAPDQIVRALDYFNQHGGVQVVAILRGGGSADDLSAFNDEKLVRAIAASKIPVITGIGHEVDESLADLAADVRASTPSNAAEMLSRDREAERRKTMTLVNGIGRDVLSRIENAQGENCAKVHRVGQGLTAKYIEPIQINIERKVREVGQGLIAKYIEPVMANTENKVREIAQGLLAKYIEPTLYRIQDDMERTWQKIQTESCNLENLVREKMRVLEILNPEKVLSQGYAILSGKISPGSVVKITTIKQEINAEIKEIYERKNELK